MITTLLLLTLLSAASVAIVLLVSSDTLINGYYGNFRGSFYAADSGVNVVVESIANKIQTTANPAVNPPLPAGTAWLNSTYAPYQANYYQIGDPNSWNAQFEMIGNPVTPSNPGGLVLQGPSTLAGQPSFCDASGKCTYIYGYTVTVKGQSTGTEAEEVTESGILTYSSTLGNGGNNNPPSFSHWGAFITNYSDCQGPLVPGTMTGPFFTDGQWNFGNFSNPGYTFVDSIGEPGSNVSWWPNNCSDSAYNAPPKNFSLPNFESGFQPNQAVVTPPSNSYSQAQAVLNGAGTSCSSGSCTATPPTSSQMSQELKTISGAAYPSSGNPPSSGVYIPYYTSNGQNVYGASGGGAAGGFYISGNASVTLTAGTDSGNNPTQTYTITQGSARSATTTTITVDPFAGSSGTTTVSSSGSPTLTLTGIPSQLNPDTGQPEVQDDPSGNPVYPTMIYVNGEITGLTGTIANQAGVTVTTGNITGGTGVDTDINITGDITYTSSPVGVPSDTLNSSTNAGVLGIFTNTNIYLNPDSKGNLTVDASLAALSGQTGTNANSGFYTNRSINTWTILGGRAEDHAHAVSINQGNTYYDRRFAGNFAPPWFPTEVPQPGSNPVPPTPANVSVTRTSW